MKREPIPDAVLWDFVGSERELITLPGYGVVCCSDMGEFGLDIARELLELRGAARKALNVGGGLACYATLIAPDDHRKVAVMCDALHDDGSFGQATMMVPLEVENWSCAAADVGALLPKEPA